ncbi:uncharacterized protein ColSpa_12217 [Colletotrichum spaethianum]|uniref:Uncharacterized protein n=1 Tax=Colletotrichum spaethianum TaxID=700344 RepID=A0AA37ULL7_9PEZI|nr:uncharacterized protein ColSpa_12217 [Colletotrichum spaethianum]GKT52036.1 hypothetical protein ColSpa_12217 [Colletotrichum spaethianum]
MISKIVTALHVILAVVILALTVRVLRDEANEKKGIMQILVRARQRSRRGWVYCHGGEECGVQRGHRRSRVGGVFGGRESAVNVSVGTKYACVDSRCAAIPGSALLLVQDLAPFLPSPQEVEKLQGLVDKCPNLETVLSAGLGLVLVSTILLLAGLKFRLLSFVSFGLNVIAVVLFAVVTGFAVSLHTTSQAVADLLGVEARKGGVFGASVGDLVASLVMCALALVQVFI